ncbi:MAG: UDP-glucose 4-epimerase [Gemmatales bacterium]|nr:MAG: UDP-glucose 4-epimerase [Gemmatales bacterium]
MIRSLVTGGAGFIGSHLAEVLLLTGRDVVILDDLSTGNIRNLDDIRDHSRLHVVEGDVRNYCLLEKLVSEADEVYHLAAAVGVKLVLDDPIRTASVNVGPTEAILRFIGGTSKKLFLASTSEVYGKNPKTPLSEEDDLLLGPSHRGRWIYACSKALDEYLALGYFRKTGLSVIIGRLFNVVGPRQVGDYGMVLPRFINQALHGGPITVHDDGQQVRCFANVTDVVRTIVELMDCPEAVGKVVNLGSDEAITIRQLAELVAECVTPGVPITHISYADEYGQDFEDVRHRVPDLTRLRNLIGYRPAKTIRDTVLEVLEACKRALPMARGVDDSRYGPHKRN